MSIDSRTRSLLLGLSDADLIRVAGVRGLGHAWSQEARTGHDDFARGAPRALRAVKAAIMRDAVPFAELLAQFWEREVEPAIEALDEKDADGDATNLDAAAFAAKMAARKLGEPVARAFLSAVACGDLAVAREVSERFDELVDTLGDVSAETPTDDAGDALSATADVPGETPTHDASQPADPAELLATAMDLRTQGIELATRLRAAADALSEGRPAEPLTLRADNWSAAVQAHLQAAKHYCEASDLAELQNRLSAIADDMSKRSESARSALQTIELLVSQDLDDMVAELLERVGFSSVEEVRRFAVPTETYSAADQGSDELETLQPDLASDNADASVRDSDLGGDSDAPEEDQPPVGLESSAGERDSAQAVTTTPPRPHVPASTTGPADAELVDLRDESEHDVSPHEASETINSPVAAPPVGKLPQSASLPADILADLDEASALDEGRLPDFPWDEGTPPLIARLILQDRHALAYHVAVAAGETKMREALLKLACAAAHCTPDALKVSLSQLIPSEPEIDHLDTNEVRLLLASALRIGLTLGYAPLGLTSLVDRADLGGTSLAGLTRLVAGLAQRGYRRGSEGQQPSEEDLATRWTEGGAEASALAEALSRKHTRYQRSSRVLHHIARDTEPVGHALVTAAKLTQRGVNGASDDQWTDIERVAQQLVNQSDRQRLINEVDHQLSSSQQRRSPITAGALAQLHDNLSQAGTVLRDLLAVRRAIVVADDPGSIASVHDLNRELAEAPSDPPAQTVGDAALSKLLTWLRSETAAPQAASVEAALNECLAALYEVPRDEEGLPTLPPTTAEIASLLTPRADTDVIAGYLNCGNITAARAYIEARGLEGQNDDEILRATNKARATHLAAVVDAERAAARLRALGQDDAALLVTEEIDAHRQPARPDRFDLVIQPLQEITATAEQDLEAVRQQLRDQTAALDAPEDSKTRILERLGHGDEALAVEYLRDLQAGQPLPEFPESHGDDFSEFYPHMVEAAAAAQAQGQDPVEAVRTARGSVGEPAEQLKDGLEAWRTIRLDKRRDPNTFRWSVAQVLRMVGLVPPSEGWFSSISRTQRSGFATFRVKATAVDLSYVPQLGTQAHGSYDVTFVWATVSPRRLMDFIDEKNVNRPNVIFYFGVLDVDERRRLRNETLPGRGKGFSPVVIDEAVIGWLSTLRESSWRFTQRVTLPFTTINPYTPFAGGEVPDEVFVGREEERRRIESPTGSMFVYGGRQLGKSALLRRVERMFTDRPADPGGNRPSDGNVALYIDLKAQGIGESQEPAALWPLLGQRLKTLGVIPAKERVSGPEEVSRQISRWLNADTSNKLLLLLDEADNFLTTDAKAGASGAGAFPVLQALKGIMESSQRRFKPVFAGLHQVQRFHDMSNTPVAHGGEDILIGPLKNSDAYRLVVDPMNALGYQFESLESVWRLLLVTNYQASLVQIVCEALVKHVQGRSLPDGNDVRIVVSERDVQDVCADPSVRDLIALRFRWTINLDSRYRVIALVVALNSIDDGPGRTLTIDEIREQCETFWPTGFDPAELSRKNFERYLDEMVGLRVLRRHEGRYGLRSPYIIQMLGSKDSLEHELWESPQHLERPLEYNPTTARQIIGDSTQVWSARSPLTDHDLVLLLADNPESAVQIVVGSEALGVDRVARVLTDAARAKSIEVIAGDMADAFDIDKRQFGKRTHAILDISGADFQPNLAEVCASLSGRRNLTATVVVGPKSLPALESVAVPVHPLRRWSKTDLRAWYESPFEEPKDRESLYLATSGWPKLVEEVMLSYAQGTTPDNALGALTSRMAESDEAKRFLDACAMDLIVARIWVEWFVKQGSDGAIIQIESPPAEDLTDVLGRSATPILEHLEMLDIATQHGDRWTLDHVVALATITASK